MQLTSLTNAIISGNEEETEELSRTIAEKTNKKMRTQNANEKDEISDLQNQIRAKRKARKLIDKRSKEKTTL